MNQCTFIEQVDPTICLMNYERGIFKKKYLLEDIETILNDEGVPAIYVTLKTNSPQMYYIVAEITDFDMIADPMPQDDQVELLKIIFDRQPFVQEFNKLYTKRKTDELADMYLEKLEKIKSLESSKENSLEALRLGVEFGTELKKIPVFIAPKYSESSSNSERDK